MTLEEHRRSSSSARVAILATSDTRTVETDEGGRWAQEFLEGEGHACVARTVVKNDRAAIRARLEELLAGPADFVLVTGGTGVSARDVTAAAVTPLLDRVLPGFGELFRALSFQEIGAAAMMSGALLGVARGKAVACVPGSPGAVKLALTRLVGPELRHLVGELRK